MQYASWWHLKNKLSGLRSFQKSVKMLHSSSLRCLKYSSFEVLKCFLTLLSVHVCHRPLADRTHRSAGVPWLIMDWVCGTHLTLKAYQLHSGWQPPYPQSIIPTKRRSSCWGNHALSVLLKGHFNIRTCEWTTLNCLTQRYTLILCHVLKCQGCCEAVEQSHRGSLDIAEGCKSEIEKVELCVKQLRELFLCLYSADVKPT